MKGVRGIFRKSGGDRKGEGDDDEEEQGGKESSGGFDLKVNFPLRRRRRERQANNESGEDEEAEQDDDDDDDEEDGDGKAKTSRQKRAVRNTVDLDNVSRPVYRAYGKEGGDESENHNDDDTHMGEGGGSRMNHRRHDDDDDDDEGSEPPDDQSHLKSAHEVDKMRHIEKSAGTSRLNRILSKIDVGGMDEDDPNRNFLFNRMPGTAATATSHLHHNFAGAVERISDPKNLAHVSNFAARVVVPPLKVDRHSIGGTVIEGYPESMQQETLLCFRCQNFESQGAEAVAISALQYPGDFKSHKRSLGLYGGSTTKGRNKLRYVFIARSTNKPLVAPLYIKENKKTMREIDEGSERGDYDAMFAPEEGENEDFSVSDDNSNHQPNKRKPSSSSNDTRGEEKTNGDSKEASSAAHIQAEEEISSFPVLVCMTLHHSGTAPDIRKLIRLDQLTTVQDLHATVVQLAFRNGDTVRLDFGYADAKNEYQEAEGSMDKERFIWSLLQIHAMLCVSVVEHNAQHLPAGMERTFLPPLNVRNLDRAELQYVATVNGFLGKSDVLPVLLDRHREMLGIEAGTHHQQKIQLNSEEKVDLEEVDSMAYDLMMGNFATRITLFQSEEERKDAEDILNSIDLLDEHQTAVLSVAERLSTQLEGRMRALEAETCRRLIAWEDEKAAGRSHKLAFMSGQPDEDDSRDSVDALALASLFKTLESLDAELLQMEEWLQDRAAAIKPLTDDCADIEEENRQLEQQWKSYELLGSEIRRLLIGLNIPEDLEDVLKNPARALVYDEDGMVDVEESEHGVEQIFEAGKVLQDAIEYPRKTGGMHLRPVSQRAKGLTTLCVTFCKQLAQIIVTVMEQFKTEVVAGSDNGKVSKNDTHAAIARKIRDTQRKFQTFLLGYIKLIEVLAALSPEMLPALRESYSEMVSEGILMKKRMKGYFQALPGKNLAYLNRVGVDLKDYTPPLDGDAVKYEGVNAPDIKAALSELLPLIAREAYYTSALFGNTSKEQDGREKKRNFETSKTAVDSASQHFRYYIYRTCGISSEAEGHGGMDISSKCDPMLCLVSSIYLNEIMDNYIDREKKGGDHSLSLAYVRASILDLRKRADKLWVNWVEKQIEWIRSSDGVPITGKRAGVFPSFFRFPYYLDHVMYCCKEGRPAEYFPDLASIKVINYYMQKMASAMLDSLRECANRETTDKQYASNVMQMENTYYFTQAMKERGPVMEELFAKQILKANTICKDSTDTYLGWMIKREFTALHDLFSRVSKLRKNLGDTEVAKNIPKHQFVRTLTKEANREILKEKISSMFSRMEKHLSEDGGLLPVAWKALVKVLYEWFGRWEKLSSSIYRHKIDPNPVDVVRIAKAAGGGARPKQQQGGSDFAFKSIMALGNKSKDADE